MMITLKPETERLVAEEIQRGHFQSVDDLIVKSLHAWRDRHGHFRMNDAVRRREAVDRALAFAKDRAISLGGVPIKDLLHEGHRI